MATTKTKLTVGLFLAIGLALTVVAIIWLGMNKYFDKGERYVAYFSDSVQGLAKDSPVKYRGVPVGRVEDFRVAPDGELIEVLIMFDKELSPEEHIPKIVAQLKTIGITGIMFIELDQKKENEPDVSPKLKFQASYPVIATKPSELTKILKGVDDIVNQVQSLDFEEIAAKIKTTLNKINRLADNARIGDISADVRSVLGKADKLMDAASHLETLITDADTTVRRVDRLVAQSEPGIKTSIGRLSLAMQKADRAMTRFNGMLVDNESGIHKIVNGLKQTTNHAERMMQDGSGLIRNFDDRLAELHRQLLMTSRNLKTASENLNILIDRVSDQPSQLFFGEPAPPRKIENDFPER